MDAIKGRVVEAETDAEGSVWVTIVDDDGNRHKFRAANLGEALASAVRRQILAATGHGPLSHAEQAEAEARDATDGAATTNEGNFRLVQAQVAQVHATLALVEAVERLTGHIERVWRRT